VSLFEVKTTVLLRNKILWLCLFLIPVAWQLWIPPYTGLADNGDFVKVVGRASLAAIDPGPQSTFHFFNRLWRNEPNALWVSPYWGIEVWLAKLAMWIGNTNPFDIRWLGLVHVIIFAAAIWLLIQRRIAPTLFALIAFTDAAYVTYFQSFYFDAASIVFLLLLIAAWHADQPALPTLAAIGFSLANAPHAPLAILLALMLIAERKQRYWPAARMLLCGGSYMLSQTKDDYKATAYYNLTFFKLGPLDPTSLDSLGIRPEDRRLIHTHAFMPDSPAQSTAWLNNFYPKGGYSNALRYYATNPLIAAKVLWADLADEAPQIRAINLGNYERSSGKRFCTLSTSFGWYSAAKSWLFKFAPWHIFLMIPFAAWRIGNKPLLWAILAIGGYEFAIASLADACETYRHLLLFHLAYDLLLWLAVSSLTVTQPKQATSV